VDEELAQQAKLETAQRGAGTGSLPSLPRLTRFRDRR
jgi:hypothetical protein